MTERSGAYLPSIAGEAARRFGDASAYVSPAGVPTTYRDLDRGSGELAAGLARRGVGPGDVVALLLPSSSEYAIAYLAAAKLGAITAGVNTRLSAPERAAVLDVASPRVVLDDPDGIGALLVPGASVPPLERDDERPVAIIFTSGTTGTPKGVVFGDRQLRAITAIDVGERWGGGARQIAGTSFAHLGFMTKLAGNLRGGGTSWIMDRWSADAALDLVGEHRVEVLGGIPTQVALMLQSPRFATTDVASVRAIVIGGGPATAQLVRDARAGFGAPIAIRYSCTEAGIGIGTAFDAPAEDAEVSVGRPHPGVELTIRAADAALVAAGEVGEVCLRSDAVMSRYWRDPDATTSAFTADGAVRTGDLGWIDGAGRLHLAGRSKEMYVRGGYNVYPLEVESVLAAHPAVAQIAVVARRDTVMGEIGVAVIVPRDASAPPSLPELRAFGSTTLAAYKLPEAMQIVASLPLTAMEKVDRRALSDVVARATAER
jgi:acyl-CoA synthetase (AMP-forming)/AMP-acid ligase II